MGKLLNIRNNISFDDIISQKNYKLVSVCKVARKGNRFRNSSRASLHAIGEIKIKYLCSTAIGDMAVAQKRNELFGVFFAGNNAHFLDVCLLQSLKRIVDHRVVGNRQ